jgi:hydrogenase maturation protease
VVEPRRRIVLGLGNILNRDEGLGVHGLEVLKRRLPPDAHFEALDGGVLGLALLPLVENASHLLLLDAVDAGKAPGTVIELEGADIPLFFRAKLSWHQLGFQEVLELARARGHFPERLHLVGAQPADISTGDTLSEVVAAALPEVVERSLRVLERWRED